jgi:class 3 adenylate cyclase
MSTIDLRRRRAYSVIPNYRKVLETPMQCPRCLRDNSENVRTCAVCGERLEDTPHRENHDTRDADSGERRQLTVVFSDIVDSTAIAGRLDPEDMGDVIRSYQEVVVEATRRFGGTVAQYLGDGMVVYFGYPHASEDAAYRAVRSALAVFDEMARTNERLTARHGVRLALRIGIHTGYALVTELIGDTGRDTAPIGDTMHIASRLSDVGSVDSVLVSDATHRLVRGFFESVSIGSLRLKGVANLIEAHRITGPSAVRSRFEAAASRGLTPFIGREPESGVLDECWAATEAGRGHVVLIVGDAGIGKSRLIHELRTRLDAGRVHTLLAACTPEGQDRTFHPILDLAEQILGSAAETAACRRAHLEEVLRTIGGGAPGAAPLIARLLGLSVDVDDARQELSPEAEHRRLINAFSNLLLLRARSVPFVLVIEDLHWADASTVELLDDLMRRVSTVPMLLLLSARPDFAHEWPEVIDARISVERLSSEDARLLVRAMTGENVLPPGLVDDVVRVTDGVPLFVEEFTRTLIESPDSEPHGYIDDWAAGAMPSTLRDLLMTRLDNLGSVKDLAQLAAVLGRTFDIEILAAVANTSVMALEPDMKTLAAAGLVFEEGGDRRGVYVFKHALVRDAAYDALLRRRRRILHERVARTLEREFPSLAATHPELLAYHLTEAAQADEAVTWWERAAARAVASYAGREAIRHLKRALELLAAGPATSATLQREADLRVALCGALYMSKGTGAPEVGDALMRARDVCERAHRDSDLHYVLYMLAGFHNLRAEYDAGQRIARDALVLADIRPSWRGAFPPSMARAGHLATLCAALLVSGDFTRTLEVARGAMAAGADTEDFVLQMGMAHPVVAAHSNASLALWMLGFPDQATATVDHALKVVSGTDAAQSYSVCFARCFAAHVRLHRREPALALAEADALIAVARERGMEYWLDTGKFLRAGALVLANDGPGALAELAAAFERAAQGSDTRIGTSMALSVYAAAYALVGRIDVALGFVRAGIAFAAKYSERAWYPELCRLEGTLLLAEDPNAPENAESRFLEALRAARAQGGRAWELRAATSLATLRRGTPRIDEAHEALRTAYNAYGEGFDTPDLRDARELLAALEADATM